MDKKHTCFFQQRGAPLKKGAYGFMRRLFPFVLVSVGILIGCSESSSGGKGGGDNTAPTVSSVSVSNTAPNKLAITFSENVTIAGSADFGFSVVTDSPPPPVITAKEGSGAAWALTLSRAVAAGETLTLTYAGNAVKDTAGNALAAFTGKAIVNNVSGEGAIVESVSITDSLTQLNKGDSHTFHALVTGQNNPSQAVTWTVTGKDAAD
ncbi:MAG: Ig-like domain-containing protein, partial [Treponema sp.]|nr:Ig-like domain-containing protein [Treponema sp.]